MEIRKPGNKGFKKNKILVTLFLITLFLTGCVSLPDPETTQDYNKTQVAVVSLDQTVGQTFISRRPRLNGIDLWLHTDSPGQQVIIELFHNIGDPNPVFAGNFRR